MSASINAFVLWELGAVLLQREFKPVLPLIKFEFYSLFPADRPERSSRSGWSSLVFFGHLPLIANVNAGLYHVCASNVTRSRQECINDKMDVFQSLQLSVYPEGAQD